MSKMYIMRGLPASGKSTKAKEIVERDGNTVRLNKDLLRTMLHFDKFSGTNEGITQDASTSLATHLISRGLNVIIDDTNLNPKTVNHWIRTAGILDTNIEYVDMDTPVDECIERDSKRDKKVGESVIQKMALQYKDYMKGEKVVICDIDGTIADCSHRQMYARGPEKDWDKFFSLVKEDVLRKDVIDQVFDLAEQSNAGVIFVSARPEKCREDTVQWFWNTQGIEPGMLLMRENHDKRDDTEVKSDIYDKYLKNLSIIKVFDDRPKVIRMWRGKGLEVEDVGTGEEF